MKVSQNISNKPLKQCDCSLSSFYSGCRKKSLYPYFICEYTKLFLLNCFTLLSDILH